MGPSRNVSLNILSMDVTTLECLDNFIITRKGDVKVLNPIEQLVWEKFGHLSFVRKYGFDVNDDKLNELIAKNFNANPKLKAIVLHLKLRGRLNLPSNEKPEQKELRERIQTLQKHIDDTRDN